MNNLFRYQVLLGAGATEFIEVDAEGWSLDSTRIKFIKDDSTVAWFNKDKIYGFINTGEVKQR